MDSRLDESERHRHEVKQSFYSIIRAKLYGVIAVNTLESITNEIDNLLPYELEKDNIDAHAEQYRKYHNGILFPTSYSDQMDRAVKSLSKDLGIAVSVELLNTQAVKKVLMKCIRGTSEEERQEVANWLALSNEKIMKSDRFEDLVNKTCLYFYKKTATEISDDNISFIKRSANELLRNKASKESLRKRLLSSDYHYDDEIDDIDVSHMMYMMQRGDSNDPRNIMLLGPSTINQPNQQTMNSMQDMSGMTSVGNVVGISSMNGIPVATYDGMHMTAQRQAIISGRDVDGSMGSGMSIPMNTMGMSLNLSSIPSINISGMQAISMGSLQLPMGMSSIPTMSMGMMDSQRGYETVSQAMDMSMEDQEDRSNGA